MEVLVKTENKEGLMALLGQTVTLFCCRYIYTGKLVGVNEKDVKLENPRIVYETGSFTEPEWKDAQALPKKVFYIRTDAIESYGIMKEAD